MEFEIFSIASLEEVFNNAENFMDDSGWEIV